MYNYLFLHIQIFNVVEYNNVADLNPEDHFQTVSVNAEIYSLNTTLYRRVLRYLQLHFMCACVSSM